MLVRLAMVVLLSAAGAALSAQVLDPQSFTSLGAASPVGSVDVDTSASPPTWTEGATTLNGEVSGGVAVFAFDSVSIGAAVTVTITGNRPAAILSQGDFTLEGTVIADAAADQAGPGGHGGATAAGRGDGPGGGEGTEAGGAGGGFGGNGGNATAFGTAFGGLAYGDLRTLLEGGSGGGMSDYTSQGAAQGGAGGGGGGAIQLGATGTMTIASSGLVSANGGRGRDGDSVLDSGDGGGGGAGGGILVHAGGGTHAGVLMATGGNGGNGVDNVVDDFAGGGGGGGGRIVLLGLADNGTNMVNGGDGGLGDFGPDGDPGGTGVFSWSASVANQNPVINAQFRANTATPLVISDGDVVHIGAGSSVADAGFRFEVTDPDTGDQVELTTNIFSIAQINGAVPAEWQIAMTSQPAAPAEPATGSFNSVGFISIDLHAADDAGGSASLSFRIVVGYTEFQPTTTLPAPIPDGSGMGPGELMVNFHVTGMNVNITNVAVMLELEHTWIGDLSAELIAPNGAATHFLFNRVGRIAAGVGDESEFGGRYWFHDGAQGDLWATAAALPGDATVPSGEYRSTGAGSDAATSMNAAFAGVSVQDVNGTWRILIRDHLVDEVGDVLSASLLLNGVPTGPLAPTITSTPELTAVVDEHYEYRVVAVGSPIPTLTVSGISGSWLSFDVLTGVFSGTPTAADAGTLGPIVVTATNSEGVDDQVFSIQVVDNAPPVITVTTNSNPITEGDTILTSLGTAVSSLNLVISAVDPDGDTVTIETTVSPSGNILAVEVGEWGVLNPLINPVATPVSGLFDTAGLVTVTVTAFDSLASSSVFRFYILVPVPGNLPPNVEVPANSMFSGNIHSGFSFTGRQGVSLQDARLRVVDPEGDDISVLMVVGATQDISGPGLGTFGDGTVLHWSGIPSQPGVYVFQYTITDGNTVPVTFDVRFLIEERDSGGGGSGGGCSTSGTSGAWLLLAALTAGAWLRRRRVRS
jgi:subtilisin-like proprotein convertase family protein